MNQPRQPANLAQLLDRIGEAEPVNGRVRIGSIVNAVGSGSFGPLILLAGLITLAPLIGDIPGMPTLMGLMVLLSAGQLLLRRRHFWLPRWLLNRAVAKDKLDKALKWLHKPARFIDRFLRARLTVLVRGPASLVIAIVCIIIALAMPPMEVVPFSANGAGLALTAFGLALIAEDGLLALLAFLTTAITLGLVIYFLL